MAGDPGPARYPRVVNSAVSSQVGAPNQGRRRRRAAVLTGLVVALLVLAGGLLFYADRPAEYEASSTLVVLPNDALAEAASYYDTLSQGQIVTTFAEILDLQATSAADGDAAVTSVAVDVVPDTSLIRITATAADAQSAETATDAVLAQSQVYFDQLTAPYQISVVQGAGGTAEQTGLAPGLLSGAVAAVALIAGLATYLAVRALLPARQLVRPAAEEPATPSYERPPVARYQEGARAQQVVGGGASVTQPVRVGEAGSVAPQSAR